MSTNLNIYIHFSYEFFNPTDLSPTALTLGVLFCNSQKSSQRVPREFLGVLREFSKSFWGFLWITIMYAVNFGGRFLLFLTRSKSNSKSLQKGNLARLIELFDSGPSPHPVLKLYETKCYIVVLRGSIANFSTLKLNLV